MDKVFYIGERPALLKQGFIKSFKDPFEVDTLQRNLFGYIILLRANNQFLYEYNGFMSPEPKYITALLDKAKIKYEVVNE